MLAFNKIPPLGTVVMLDDQAFELASTMPHARKDGSETELLIWQSECASCGAAFSTSSPIKTNGLTRRCQSCRKPGKPVKGKRGRAVIVEIIKP